MNPRKKNTLFYSLILALLLVNDYHANAGSGDENGLVLIKKAYAAEDQFYQQTISAGKMYHLKCVTVSEVFNDKNRKYEPTSTTEEVFASQHMRHTISDEIEVFMDEHDVFSINRNTNILTHTKSALNKVDLTEAILFKKSSQDSLLKNCLIVNKGIELVASKKVIHFELLPKNNNLPYKAISFYIEPETFVFRKMYFEINPAISKLIKSYTVNIIERNTTNPDYKLEKLHDHFLNSNGTLKTPYNRYHFKDLAKGNN